MQARVSDCKAISSHLQLILDSGVLGLARRLGLGLLGFLLTVAACRNLFDLGIILLDRFFVHSFNIRVRRSDTLVACLFFLRRNLMSLGVDDASSGFVASLEFDFALESLDLLFIQQIAVLVAVLDTFLFTKDTRLGNRWGARDPGVLSFGWLACRLLGRDLGRILLSLDGFGRSCRS